MHGDTTTIRDYLRIIFRRKMILVVAIIPMVIINFVTNEFKTPTYTASALMVMKFKTVATSEQYQSILGSTDMLMRSQLDFVKSKKVVERVVKALKLYELSPTRELNYATPMKQMWLNYVYKKTGISGYVPSTLSETQKNFLIDQAVSRWQGSVSVGFKERTSMFMIGVRDLDEDLAIKVANAISRSYLIFDLEQQIAELELKYGDKHSTIVQKRRTIQKLTEMLDKEVITGLETIPTSVKILEEAKITAGTEKQSSAKVIVFPLIAGLFLGITIIVMLDFFNQTVKSPKDAEEVVQADLLGSVPKIKARNKLINSKKVNPDYLNAYKQLSGNIYMKMMNDQLKSVLITDADGSKDMPGIIANLGMYLSSYDEHKVLIVDLNLRVPALVEAFHVASDDNLIDVIEGKISIEEAIKEVGSNLHYLYASKPAMNPLSFFDSSNLKEMINEIKDNYDLTIVYCADLKNYKDALVLSSYTDGTIIVMNEGETHKGVTKYLLEPLKLNKINMIGTILNNRTYDIPNIIYKLT